MNHLEVLAILSGAAAFAALFWWVKMPVWHITGGLSGATVVHLALGGEVQMPESLSIVSQILIGAAIGSTIGSEVFRAYLKFLFPGSIAVLVVVSGGVAFGYLFHLAGLLPLPEAILAMVPGGMGEMVTAAVAVKKDSAIVAGIHLIRMLVVIWTLPLFIRFAEFLNPSDLKEDDSS